MLSLPDEADRGTSAATVSTLKGRWDGLACAAILAICFALTHPTAELPRGDDFSYAKTALEFAHTGRLVYNAWATAAVGWQAVWGAGFIRLFGFSHTLLRFSTLVLAMGSLVAFQRLLRSFGLERTNALLGTLTLGLSPLFLDLSVSFMTDIPGLLFLLVCAWMCQRAVASDSDRRAIVWLAGAVALNLLGGTVRQTTWLGALIMVPSTAWYVWGRRNLRLALAVMLSTFSLSLIAVVSILHWCYRQPYFVHERLLPGGWRHRMTLTNLAQQPARAFATLVVLVLPVGIAWLLLWAKRLRNRSDAGRVRAIVPLAGVASFSIVGAAFLLHSGTLNAWIFPWNPFNLMDLGAGKLPDWLRVVISVIALLAATAWLIQVKSIQPTRSERQAFWILGPCTLTYALLLVPRGLYTVYDRYELFLMVGAIVTSLLLYERQMRRTGGRLPLPLACGVCLSLFAAYATASVHDAMASLRTSALATGNLEAAGVARTAITNDLGPDSWVQVSATGHVNFPIPNPAGSYHAQAGWEANPACEPTHSFLVPVIQPKYIVRAEPSPCYQPSPFPPLMYRAWLPPFKRYISIQQLH